jgi:hypothetical protein
MSAAGLMASEADRAALARVLAQPEFQAQRWRGDALRQWLAGWWARLTELLGTAEAERWAGLGRAVFLAAVAVALLLLWRAARRRRAMARTAPRRREQEDAASSAPGTVTVADAEGALATGDAPEAVRLAFLAAIAALRRQLPSSVAAVLTGNELAGRVADEGFGQLARLHERTIYGRRPVTSQEAVAALAVAARMASRPAAGRAGGGPEVAP